MSLRNKDHSMENSLDSKELGFKKEFIKREPDSGPYEYGWGGGRWGKRSGSDAEWDEGWDQKRADDLMKRYDAYSIGGRFGKRFGGNDLEDYATTRQQVKRDYVDINGKRYDPFSVGGRFGKRSAPDDWKRYDPFSVGGRFGKRSVDEYAKRYDQFSLGGRFGKRADELMDKRYDQFSLGGRFGKRGGIYDPIDPYYDYILSSEKLGRYRRETPKSKLTKTKN